MKTKDVLLANHHSALITLGRVYDPNVEGDPAKMKTRLDHRAIPSGHVVAIPAEEWEIRKKSQAVQYYLDNGHLQVVKRTGEAEVCTDSIVDLEVPEHLQPDTEGNVTAQSVVDGSQVKASIRHAKKGTVDVG